MLCHGDHISACILRRALDEFSMTSGLYPNMFKSTVFYGNVPDTVKDEIQFAMPFREGVLPARYLGIPLTAKTLSIADCRVLIEKVKNRILDWRNKLLSLAGKLQLVASVLSSLHVYWASMFILPVFVCNSIDKLLKNFVWSKNDAAKGIASVAWKEVCRPKDEGGLGLKSLKVMNHALMVKHLWNIASKKDSLWVKWLNVYRIKGNCIWDLNIKKNSWNLKQILSLRDSIRMNVGYKIGNRESGLNLNAKIADLFSNNNWDWPNDWSVRFKEVIDVSVPVLDHDRDDMALWFDKQNVEVRISVKEACKDSHSHLFFQCGFAQGVWERLKSMSRLEDLSCVWAEIISGISIRKANNTLWSIIQRLVLGAAVYFIWRERNFRLFRNMERSNDAVFDNIVDTVRLKLLGLNIKRSVKSDTAAAIWRLPIKDVGKEWGRRLLFSDPMLVITLCFCEVRWGGLGYLFWIGVIRECRVDYSYVMVMMLSPWEGCKPSLDASWDWVQVWFSYGSSLGCSGLGLSKDSGTGFEKLIQISIVFRMSSLDSDMFRWNVDGSISMILLVYFHDHILGNLNMGQFKAQASVDKENRGEVKVKSNMSAGNVNNDQDGWQNVDYRRGNRVFGNSFQQRSFNGYNGRGNMGYRGRDGYSNKGSNSFVNNEVKENLSKYVSVKNKEKVVNVDECLVTDEVMKTKPSTGADKLSKEDVVNNGLGNRGSNGKSNRVNGKESTGMDDVTPSNLSTQRNV
ncbi:hypothetical protein Tco_1014779 [Tanacetum coccineum]